MKKSILNESKEIDPAAIYAVLSDVYETAPWNKEQIATDMARVDTSYYYAVVGDELVGFLATQELAGDVEITNIAVKTAYQGQGIARELVAELLQKQTTLFLEVRKSNEKARALYEGCGFEVVGSRKNYYHNPVEDAILMTRSIKDEENEG